MLTKVLSDVVDCKEFKQEKQNIHLDPEFSSILLCILKFRKELKVCCVVYSFVLSTVLP